MNRITLAIAAVLCALSITTGGARLFLNVLPSPPKLKQAPRRLTTRTYL